MTHDRQFRCGRGTASPRIVTLLLSWVRGCILSPSLPISFAEPQFLKKRVKRGGQQRAGQFQRAALRPAAADRQLNFPTSHPIHANLCLRALQLQLLARANAYLATKSNHKQSLALASRSLQQPSIPPHSHQHTPALKPNVCDFNDPATPHTHMSKHAI